MPIPSQSLPRRRQSMGQVARSRTDLCFSWGTTDVARMPGTLHQGFRQPLRRTQRVARGLQRVDQRFLWQLTDNRFDHPSQANGDVARQRNGPALDAHAVVPLLETPIGLQTPQKAITCVGRQHLLFFRARILYFSDSRGMGPAAPASIVRSE